MNDLLRSLERQSGIDVYGLGLDRAKWENALQKFTKMVVDKTLDEVAERAYYSGDRAWSNELDRAWVELEFGFGNLAELKNESCGLG